MNKERRFGPVLFLPGENRGKYPFCNSFYVEGAGVLIDPACERKRLEQLRDGPGVTEVWLSHWHEDHFMHLGLFDDLPLVMPRRDAPPLGGADTFMDWYALDDPNARAAFAPMLEELFHFRPRVPARVFDDDETLKLAGVSVEVLHVPGHTPGHSAFFFREPRVLLLSDYDLTPFGPWYGDRDSSIEDTIASIHRLRGIDASVWLTAHESGVFEQDPGEAWDLYLAVIDRREEALLAFLDRPRTMMEIVNQWIVYRKPREPRAFFEHGERANMAKHLQRLLRGGAVRMVGDRYVRD